VVCTLFFTLPLFEKVPYPSPCSRYASVLISFILFPPVEESTALLPCYPTLCTGDFSCSTFSLPTTPFSSFLLFPPVWWALALIDLRSPSFASSRSLSDPHPPCQFFGRLVVPSVPPRGPFVFNQACLRISPPFQWKTQFELASLTANLKFVCFSSPLHPIYIVLFIVSAI